MYSEQYKTTDSLVTLLYFLLSAPPINWITDNKGTWASSELSGYGASLLGYVFVCSSVHVLFVLY